MQRHALTDEQWARLQPLLPTRPQGRKATHGDRLFVDAVIFRAKTGIQWRDLPDRFGKWKSVYNRFAKLGAEGRLGPDLPGAANRHRRNGFDR
jgi:transposase